ncbi:hypothetical protein IFR05_014824 [Cadophora sp. M221]|nr:hypothetical protein IFR05_014824 [Cadophora sp. M221]
MAPALDINTSPPITPTTSKSHNSNTHPSSTSSTSKPPILAPSHPLTLPFTTLDVFTSTPYTGNPLALIRIPCTLRTLITQQQKQKIAAEFNLSETIFLHEQKQVQEREQEKFGQSSGGVSIPVWDVEIFTTYTELPFAGHPVIGAAAYVLGVLGAGGGKGRFRTRAGGVDIQLVYDHERDFQVDGDERDREGVIEPNHKNISTRVSADIPHNVHIHTHKIGDLKRPTGIPGLSLHPSIRKAELEAPIGVEMGRKSVIGVEVFVSEGLGCGGERRSVESVKISGNAVVVMEGNLRV